MRIDSIGCARPRVALWFLSVALTAYGSGSPECRAQTLDEPAQFSSNAEVYAQAVALVDDHFFDPSLLADRWEQLKIDYAPRARRAADTATLYQELNELFSELSVSHLIASPPLVARDRQAGEATAVGFRAQELDGTTVVVDVNPGSHAAQAGIEPGWAIAAVNGIRLPFESETLRSEALNIAPGQPVRYEFVDLQDQPHSMVLSPARLSVNRREARLLEGNIVYLRFDQFDLGTARWLSRQLKDHDESPAVVLDLRFNSGGSGLATRLALGEFDPGWFNNSDEPAGVWIDRDDGRQAFGATSLFSADYQGKVAILTDQATRSAAEVFARVLQYQGRAIIVGRVTAGAVIAAERYELPDGGSLTVPVRDYRDPAGERLEGRGVEPDAPVELTLAALRVGDPDLSTALQMLSR